MDAEAKRRRVTAEASLASPPTVRAPAGAFETPARGKTDGEARDGGASGASTATPLPTKRKARAGETGEGMVFAAMPTFARALRDASNANGADWARAEDARAATPCRGGRPLASPPPMKASTSPPAPPRKQALSYGMSYGYTPSRGDTRYDASERVDCEEPATPALAGPCAMIPSALDAALGLPMIDGAALRALLANHESGGAGGPEVVAIDCRFPFEYAGGRVRSALNLYSPTDVQKFLASRATTSANVVYVFYCEFSSERAPRMWRHVRNLDRRDHMATYPALSFPHTYVLQGGYKHFYESFPECCEGGFVSMSDTRYTDACREFTSQSREVWFVAQRAKSMTHAPSPSDEALFRSAERFRGAVRGRGIDFTDMDDD